MFKVSAWNQYNIDGSGKLVISHDVATYTVPEAMDYAEFLARKWNKASDPAWRVNIISCCGYVRAVL
jgi:hypothetical protein